MPDWLRTTVWIVGVLALLLTLAVGCLMWRYRIPLRGLFAMGAAALYLISPIDLVPDAILGPLALIDEAGVLAAAALFVYKLVKVRRILADGGIELSRPGRRPPPRWTWSEGAFGRARRRRGRTRGKTANNFVLAQHLRETRPCPGGRAVEAHGLAVWRPPPGSRPTARRTLPVTSGGRPGRGRSVNLPCHISRSDDS